MVFTGSLRPVRRTEAIDFMIRQGAHVQGFISSQTDILVVGHKQIDLFHPEKRSRKYQAALQRMAEGQNIQLMDEGEFFKMMRDKKG